MKLQKVGGYAAIASLFAYVVFALVVLPLPDKSSDPAKIMAAVSAAPASFYLLNLLSIAIYILLLIMILALHELMQANAPYLTRLMLIAASTSVAMTIAESIINLKSIKMIIPQQDISAFRACWAVNLGLDSAAFHALAWASLFLGCAVLKTRAFSRVLGWLFLLAGILLIPNFFLVQIGFARGLLYRIGLLSFCVAIVWIGIALLRQQQPRQTSKEMAASS